MNRKCNQLTTTNTGISTIPKHWMYHSDKRIVPRLVSLTTVQYADEHAWISGLINANGVAYKLIKVQRIENALLWSDTQKMISQQQNSLFQQNTISSPTTASSKWTQDFLFSGCKGGYSELSHYSQFGVTMRQQPERQHNKTLSLFTTIEPALDNCGALQPAILLWRVWMNEKSSVCTDRKAYNGKFTPLDPIILSLPIYPEYAISIQTEKEENGLGHLIS